MRLALLIIPLLALASCVGPDRSVRARQDFTSHIDELCEWTGLRRASAIRSVELWHTSNPGSNVTVDMAVDNAVQRYLVRFDADGHFLSFQPENADLSGLAQGLGYDTVKNRRQRASCIAAVSKLNSHLKWTYHGSPAIQRDGPNYLVTYETVSKAEQKRSGYAYLDPYVSFLVTPRGTVMATFWGA